MKITKDIAKKMYAVEINGEKVSLIIEMKSAMKPITSSAAKKFVDSVKVVQKQMNAPKMMCVYLSESGFSQPAEKILKENDVIIGTSQEWMPQQDIVNKTTKTKKIQATKSKTKTKPKATKSETKKKNTAQTKKAVKSKKTNKLKKITENLVARGDATFVKQQFLRGQQRTALREEH